MVRQMVSHISDPYRILHIKLAPAIVGTTIVVTPDEFWFEKYCDSAKNIVCFVPSKSFY